MAKTANKTVKSPPRTPDKDPLVTLQEDFVPVTPSNNPAHSAIDSVSATISEFVAKISDDIRRSIVCERIGNRMFALALPQLKSFTFNVNNLAAGCKAIALRDFGLRMHGKSEYVNAKVKDETRESRLHTAIEDALNFQLNTTTRPTQAKKRRSALDMATAEEAEQARVLAEQRRIKWNKKHRPNFYGFLDGAHLDVQTADESEFDSDFASIVLEAAIDATHIKLMADVVRCDELFQQAEEDSDWEGECDNNLYLAEVDLQDFREAAGQLGVELRVRKPASLTTK
jgi:hypothetical protein